MSDSNSATRPTRIESPSSPTAERGAHQNPRHSPSLNVNSSTRARTISQTGSNSTAERYDYMANGSHDHEDPQLAQDIDAARQMSRARAGSIEQHRAGLSPTSPRAIPSSTGRRPSVRQGDDLTVPPNAEFIGPGSVNRHPPGSFVARSPLASRSSTQQQHAAAAARFYQHQRQGSNTSLDSASHFIDHRNQPHHLSVSNSHSQQHQSPVATRPIDHSRLSRSRDTANESAVADETLNANVEDIAFAQRGSRGSQRGSDGERAIANDEDGEAQDQHTPHTISRRPSALEDDVCYPLGRGGPENTQSGRMGAASPSRHQSTLHREQHAALLHGDYDEGDMYPDDQRDYEEMQEAAAVPGSGTGNLPPGFPFTFDMHLLEDYASEERSKLASSRPGTNDFGSAGRKDGLRNRNRPGAETLSPSNGATDVGYGASPDSDDATFYSRRPRKHFTSDSQQGSVPGQNQGRYQRKLALFEQGGSAPPPQGDIFGSAAGPDVNTPLLGANQGNRAQSTAALPSFQGGKGPYSESGYGGDDADGKENRFHRSQSHPGPGFPGRRNRKNNNSAFSMGASGLGAPTPADKPYRFTFYSNALPSTIHARNLAELPAKGQTFEELFSGLEGGALGGSGEAGEHKMTDTPVSGDDSARKGNNNGAATLSKPDPLAAGSNLQASALTAQLAARGGGPLAPGRKEGSTAPPTRAHTPVPASSTRHSMTGTNQSKVTSTTIAPQQQIPGRTNPGGGIRMDQDPEANTWWLDVLSPTDQEMKLLSRVFGIHPLTTEDILMEETREKIELFRNYYLVCFRSFDQDPYSPTYLEPLNMYIIVFREGTLSFHFRATPHPQNVRRRIKQLKDYINVTSDWISYALIDDITDAFGPLIQSIEYEVDSIDELVLILKDVEQSDMLRRIGACRKKVMGLLRLMGNKADVVKGLAKRCNENWSVAPKSDIGLYLSDIQDHLITMTQNLSHFEKILSRSHSNYLAQISIEMTEANNRANDVLSKLTALGTVILPLNIITGLWGMNVNVPGQFADGLHWFGGLVGMMVFLAVTGYWGTIRYLQR